MEHARELARFALSATCEDLSGAAREALKLRILDSVGCALGAMDGPPVRCLRDYVEAFGGEPRSTLIGGGGTAPDRASLLNGTLVRYLDFNDSYLAPGETCHPSDNLAAVLAATEEAGGDGRDLMTALAVAYQVQCRLSDVAPVRERGFDHVTHLAFSVAAGVARALRLDEDAATDAVAIAGTTGNALRVTRTGAISQWKGLAAPWAAANALRAAFLASRGVTGPREVFEGTRGWRETVSGSWTLDWSAEDLERVTRTDLKRFNAEIHSQAALEGLLELLEEASVDAADIDAVRVGIFDVAFDIIGGGREGEKTRVESKEQADHSLPWLLAVAALDRQVLPEQYAPERIGADDVQALMRRVVIERDPDLSERFPDEHACRLTVTTRSGRALTREKRTYQGFHAEPVPWEMVEAKARRLGEGRLEPADLDRLVEAVRHLEDAELHDLLGPLSRARTHAFQAVG
ncbi:MAG TPA: MmgE/PrpD family protein [Longimicrobiales bacterium]|nr:MmgE/PrpD family protein [Longimicrobiales bacterium]